MFFYGLVLIVFEVSGPSVNLINRSGYASNHPLLFFRDLLGDA